MIEYVSFSSRYRVDHLQEQLRNKAVLSDSISQYELNTVELSQYLSIVVYRSAEEAIIKKLHEEASILGIPVLYDIDDFIFDYPSIQNLNFLNGPNYQNFDKYCSKVFNTMNVCDGYICSTNALKERIRDAFHNKEAVVNRNVASKEMVSISLSTLHKPSVGKIVLGYFSGTPTHDNDFGEIQDVLVEIMQKYENVYLLIGGVLNMPSIFNAYQNRIIKYNYVDYRKLPELISKVDINLMPLEDTIFHECKSENKWMEAGLVKVPTIASWNKELEQVIRDGVDGFLCKNKEEWKKKLNCLIEDKELQQSMAEKVHKRVLKDYTTQTLEQEVIDILRIE